MKNTVKHLLFLNDLSSQNLEQLNTDKSLKVSSNALIRTTAIPFNIKELDTNKPWIFSSRTAVEILLAKEIPFPKTVYAIGPKTAELIPSAIIPQIATASELAKVVIEKGEKEVIFICGNRRRDELPQHLASHNMKVKEVVVYQTENLNKTVNLHGIDGLAFMSPSAVHSLAQNGGFNNLPCFAIGPTTAHALKQEGQQCITSKTTTPKSLVETAKNYFK